MKKIVLLLLSGLVITSILIGSFGCTQTSTPTQPITLDFAHPSTPTGSVGQIDKAFWDEVERVTEGRVVANFHWAGALLKYKELITGVGEGTAQAGFSVLFYAPAELPLTQVIGLPGLTDAPDVQGRAFMELYDTFAPLQEEWTRNNVKPLYTSFIGPAILGTKKEIKSMEDLAGLRIRAGGAFIDVMTKLGATPTSIPGGETYDALAKGIVDGFTGATIGGIVPRGWHEHVSYILNPGLGLYTGGVTAINLDFWDSLPADIQRTIMDIDALSIANEIGLKVEVESVAKAIEDGVKLDVLTAQEKARWQEQGLKPVWDGWVKEMEEKGLPGSEILELYRALVKEYESDSLYQDPIKAAVGK